MGGARTWALALTLLSAAATLPPALCADPLYSVRVVGPSPREERLYPDHLSALRAVPEGEPRWVSADLVLARSRTVIDGVYAAVEMNVEAGTERFATGRHAFLIGLLEALLKRTDVVSIDTKNRAIGYVAAALVARGEKGMNLGGVSQAVIDDLIAAYTGDPVRSTPIGYYAWTPKLGELFAESRLLQAPLLLTPSDSPPARFRRVLGRTAEEQFAVAKLLSETIGANKDLRGTYGKLSSHYGTLWGRRVALGPLDLDEVTDLTTLRTTNQYDMMAQRSPGGVVEWRLLPAEFTRLEGPLALAYAACGSSDTGAGVDQYLKLLRSGACTLQPPPQGSGAPERELYALEPMVLFDQTAESRALAAGASYHSRLLSLFGAPTSTEREAAPPRRAPRDAPSVKPLKLEPLPTVYLREAAAVSLLRRGLQSVLGTNSIQRIFSLRDDESRQTLGAGPELRNLEDLLLGCYALACSELQLNPKTSTELPALEKDENATYGPDELQPLQAKAEAWIDGVAQDADSGHDVRSLTPVMGRLDGQVHCWAGLGVKLIELQLGPGSEGGSERPIRLWAGVESYTEAVRRPPLPSVAAIRAELDRAVEPHRAMRVVGAGGGSKRTLALLRAACPVGIVLAGAILLLVVLARVRTMPRYAVRRHGRQPRQVRRRG